MSPCCQWTALQRQEACFSGSAVALAGGPVTSLDGELLRNWATGTAVEGCRNPPPKKRLRQDAASTGFQTTTVHHWLAWLRSLVDTNGFGFYQFCIYDGKF